MSNNKTTFFVEGFADKLILDILEVDSKCIQEIGPVTKLKKTMKNQLRYYHKTVVGVVDYDKGNSLDFFKDFEICTEPDNIILKQKPNSNQYIIFLKPKAVERWILDAAESVNLKPEDYKLPSKMKEFTKQTKHVNISQNKKMVKFITDIKKAKAEPFIYLKDILHTLLNQKEYPCKAK